MNDSRSPRPPRAIVVPVSWRAFGLIGLIWAMPWLVFFWGSRPPADPSPVVPAEPKAAPPAPVDSQSGPWGTLETTTVVIEPPDDLLSLDASPVTHSVWRFVNHDRQQLSELLAAVDLNPTAAAFLGDVSKWTFAPRWIELRVPKNVVLELSPETRRSLYRVMAGYSENTQHFAPFSFRAETTAEWFGESDLTPETIALVEPLLYRRGESLLFSDLPLILSDVRPAQQRLELLRALSRSSTQLVKLRITPDSDIKAIAAYWSPGQRKRDIEPLLRSLPLTEAGVTIDVIHLLPRLARRLLYTFPAPAKPGESLFRDCHWTSLNFHKDEIDDSFADLDLVREAYQRDFREVAGEPQFGDIIIFVRQDGTALHACIYVAGDIVFTKNGVGASSPWILMKMPHLQERYPADIPLEIMVRRPRTAP